MILAGLGWNSKEPGARRSSVRQLLLDMHYFGDAALKQQIAGLFVRHEGALPNHLPINQ